MLGEDNKNLDSELHDIVDEATESPAEHEIQGQQLVKCEKICKASIRKVGRVQTFWFSFALFTLAASASAHYFASGQDIGKLLDFKSFSFESWAAWIVGIIFLILSLTRLTSNSKSLKELKNRGKYLKGNLPDHPDLLIREIYFFYCKRRCVHYWLTVGFGALFMLCILYPILASGVDLLATWSWQPKNVKLFTNEALSYSSWKIEHKFVVMGVFGLFCTICQYFIFRSDYLKPIGAFESRFGGERIVDECLYCSRMWKINFRYKSFAFMVVCLCGCFFYLLFKRLICVIFEKSFIF